MKQLKFVIPLGVFCMLGLICCKNSANSELLINKWTLVKFNPHPDLQIPDSLKKVLENSQSIEYTADGKYMQTSAGIYQSGTYAVSDDGKLIHYNYTVGGKAETFTDTIIELSKGKLSIIEETGSQKEYKN